MIVGQKRSNRFFHHRLSRRPLCPRRPLSCHRSYALSNCCPYFAGTSECPLLPTGLDFSNRRLFEENRPLENWRPRVSGLDSDYHREQSDSRLLFVLIVDDIIAMHGFNRRVQLNFAWRTLFSHPLFPRSIFDSTHNFRFPFAIPPNCQGNPLFPFEQKGFSPDSYAEIREPFSPNPPLFSRPNPAGLFLAHGLSWIPVRTDRNLYFPTPFEVSGGNGNVIAHRFSIIFSGRHPE